MIATTNLPGSQYFDWFRGTKAECQEWLDKKADSFKESNQGLWYSCYSPARIISEKEAKKWRYQNGSLVFGHYAHGEFVFED